MTLSGPLRLYTGLVGFSVAGTLFTRMSGFDPGLIAPVAAALTLLAGTWAAIRTCRPLGWPLAAGAFGAAIELVGLATGFPFGRYEYSSRWQPAVFLPVLGYFPLLLPLAWLMVAGAAERIVRSFPAWAAVPAAGLLAALVDLVMEPVATGPLGYWRWFDPGPLPGGAPILNLVGWFAISALGAAILRRSEAPSPEARREAALVLALHLAMFEAIWAFRR